jgi:nucleotide-binding universal stress UspA family protein
VRQAIDLAKLTGASLSVVSAYEPVSKHQVEVEQRDAPADVAHEINPREDVNVILETAAAGAKQEGLEVHLHAVQDDPADAILNVAEETNADLIVVGNKGMTGARRFLLGSVPNNVSHHAPCSVIIVRTT